MLGTMYASGDQGVPKDYVQAYMWYNLAASQGDPNSMKQRDDIARLMKGDQLAQAQRLSNDWVPTTLQTPAAAK